MSRSSKTRKGEKLPQTRRAWEDMMTKCNIFWIGQKRILGKNWGNLHKILALVNNNNVSILFSNCKICTIPMKDVKHRKLDAGIWEFSIPFL